MTEDISYGKQFARLESMRNRLLANLDAHDEARLNQSPADGGWSPGQVLAHVIEAERMSLEYVRKRTQDPESTSRRTLRQWLNGVILTSAMRSPLKFEVPPTVGQPPEIVDLAALQRDWQQVRDGWREFLSSFPPELRNNAIYRHPVAGPLSLDQALAFLVSHLRRHRKQIQRALS